MTALHSTVPANFSSIPCPGCSTALFVYGEAPAVQYCLRCERSMQEAEGERIMSQIRDLAAGEQPFNLLCVESRRVLLSQINTALTYARLQLAKGDDDATVAILAGPVSREAQAIAYAHYESTAAGDPSPEECEAIYAMEEVLDREEILATEETAGSEWR